MSKISKFFKSLFGFKPLDPKRRGWTLFKSSHKQHNHDEAISADQGSIQSRPPSVEAKLMGLEALPDYATTNQKQEMGMTQSTLHFMRGYSDYPNYTSHTKSSRAKLRSISAPGGRRRSKYSNVQPNDDQHREAVGELKKATFRGTQVSREVSLTEHVSYSLPQSFSWSSLTLLAQLVEWAMQSPICS
ncbi:IQ-DOMAIN 14-like protein [Tanacetum coccineum]